MDLKFTKMHGCGNDYIYFNCFEQSIENPEQLAVALSDRHFGIGGDGIVLICPSEVADAKMRMFNADGSEGKMCGNAIRCVGKYLYDNKLVQKLELKIETLSGIKHLKLFAENGLVYKVTVDMGRAELDAEKIPVTLPSSKVVNEPVTIGGENYRITCVSMGNPHCVVFGSDPEGLDLEKIGPQFERNPIFPERVNTEFVQVLDESTLKMRVWERGSGETLACGTGACASAVAAVLNGYCRENTDIKVILRGGELVINYSPERVLMTGAAVKVFDGVVSV
ncbi:MAG TPA: diaminopimelate epimerase [Bacillota bacterium]|jgi:carbamoyl-phosphate synthase large subunit|nr:diaminopimelate epimerase [Bacillota bacterium]HOP53813.1 diaminopimelate epimerase [Bacillota bacterium]HPT60970.1 diaminopimelate epimerase [Bacillota bacterium]HPZ72289.1 diaminopimelate epimerase [Bacillota bacterium]